MTFQEAISKRLNIKFKNAIKSLFLEDQKTEDLDECEKTENPKDLDECNSGIDILPPLNLL